LYKGTFAHDPWPLRLGLMGFLALVCSVALQSRAARRTALTSIVWGTMSFVTIGVCAVPLRHLIDLHSSSWKLDIVLFAFGAATLTLLFRHPPRRRAA
jgi:hypothetical protein